MRQRPPPPGQHPSCIAPSSLDGRTLEKKNHPDYGTVARWGDKERTVVLNGSFPLSSLLFPITGMFGKAKRLARITNNINHATARRGPGISRHMNAAITYSF
jgi:hypothetical protein